MRIFTHCAFNVLTLFKGLNVPTPDGRFGGQSATLTVVIVCLALIWRDSD